MSMTQRILVVDDEESIRKLLLARFTREGWVTEVAEDGAKALELAKYNPPNAILTDIKMPGLDGFQLVDEFRKQGVDCPVIMITGHGEKECAIDAVRHGAFDYLEKPFDMDAIALVVKRALERDELSRQNAKLLKDLEAANFKLSQKLEVNEELLERAEQVAADSQELLIGVSSHVENLKTMARTVADSFRGENDPVVLITGESGVGKEMLARYLHAATFSDDRKAPFVAINCAAFPDNLLESELFGYEKGAFTGATSRKLGLFELANGGTLFLDEIGELDPKMQAKLLRVIQERVIRRLGGTVDIKVRPHIVAATNRDLAKAVSEGKFREDLFYRLNTLPILIAPLRSRVEDIDVLANHFLKTLTRGRSKKFSGFSSNALRALHTYRWPGNIRELRGVIERAVILEKGPILELSQLRQEHLHQATVDSHVDTPNVVSLPRAGADPAQTGPASDLSYAMSQLANKSLSDLRKDMDERLVRQILIETLGHEQGNVSSVARLLKLDRANLLRLLKRFGIEPELFRRKKAS